MTIQLDPRSIRSFAFGVVCTLIAAVSFASLRADAIGDDESTFVPITPCRLFDTRPGDFNVGPRSTPLGPGEEHEIQVTGNQGECAVPAGATAVAINLVAVEPTARTFLALYPADQANPGTASINVAAGASPTPNKLDVALSASGAVDVFNRFGSVHVVGDVMGYYVHDGLAALEARVEDLETLFESASLITLDGQPTLRLSGVNLQIVDGSGFTHPDKETGLGNVIIGYNENESDTRTGTHNLVIGPKHSYDGSGGIVAGSDNSIDGFATTVTGGTGNSATGFYTSVSGGSKNTASGTQSAVAGGAGNIANGDDASILGGRATIANGARETVIGGDALFCISDPPGGNAVACGEGTIGPSD